MFQTEFCGPDYKLLISWDTGNCQNYSFEDDILSDQDVFYKLNELYRNISKFSTEFVDCVKSVHGPSNLEKLQNHLHENNPNVTFKIENLKNKDSYSDELFILRQQVEKLKEENEQLMAEHENGIVKMQNEFEMQTAKLIEEQEHKLSSVKQELENKYNLEMSELRKYFENKCTESLRQFTEESYQCSKDSDSDSYSDIEPDDESYEAITSANYTRSNIDHATKGLQKILDKDLKNIRKAYIVEVDKLKEDLTKKKDEEIREFKRALETKFVSKFEMLQSQLDCLLNDKNLDDSVHSIHSQVKEDYVTELENLQNLSDLQFASKIENDFILKHNEELDKRDQEWKNHVESSLSDIVVESALKAVIKETQQKSQSCHCSPSKKYKYKEFKQLKQKYKQEIDDLRHQYENESKSAVSKFEQQIQRLSEENDQLMDQNKELLQLNEKYAKEIELLKQKTIENLQLLQSTQEKEIVEGIKDEVSKMKACYETQMSTMRDSKYALEKAFDELQSELFNIQNTRKDVISSLQAEFKDLISKEQNGLEVSWPEELKIFRQFYAWGDRKQSLNENEEQLKVSVYNDQRNSLDMSNGDAYEDDSIDLEEILRQRNTLRKVILTLYSACEGFRRYITNLDEDRNTTLTNELSKIGLMPCKISADMTLDDVTRNLNETEKENLKKINLASNMSEILSLFGGEEDIANLTLDCNKSFNQSELSCWFEKLKNDAAAILCLTSGKKLDIDDGHVDTGTQTVEDGRHYDRVQEVILSLQNEITKYQDQYAKAQSDIDELSREVDRLNVKISSFESLEAYGEGISGVTVFTDDSTKTKEAPTFSRVEEFCPECDKVRDEAKREKEDLQSQLEAASKKLKSFEQFLERETVEREAEREEFDREVQQLQSQIKEKERELCSLNNHAIELTAMEHQLKELTGDYEDTKIRNQTLETELNAISDKIWTLRDSNHDLEAKLAQKSELAENVSVKLKEKEEELLVLQQDYQTIRHELDSLQDTGCKQLDLLHEQHEISTALVNQVKIQLSEVEKTILSRTRELENNYVTVSSSNVVSSPSEDISICDRIADRVRLVSPSGSDVSSSPIHLPVNLLSCLNEKLNKLFRAEDAAFKRIQDQDMQINKMSSMIDELHLEKDTIQEKLNETSAKLAKTRMELENWQYRSNAAQSEAVSKLEKTIESLQSQIETYEKQITQKDTKLKELSAKVKHLESYIKNSETELTEKINKIESANEALREELRESTDEINKLNVLLSGHRREDNLSLSTVVEKLLEEKNQQIHQLEDKLDVFKSLAEIGDKSHSTEIESKTSSKFKGNLTETLESYVDLSVSDHTRHAVVSDLSISPRYISVSSSVKKPLLGSGTSNESTCSLQPIEEVDERVVRSEIALPTSPRERHKEVTFKDDDSIIVNLDDVSWTPTGQRGDIDRTVVHEPNVVHDQLVVYQNQLEEEKRNHFATLIQLRELNSRWEEEKKQMKEAEAAFKAQKTSTEKRLRDLEWEHVACKEQCYKYEQQVLLVTKDLDTAKQTIDTLNQQLEQMDNLKSKLNELECQYKLEQEQYKLKDQRVSELSTILEAEKAKTHELNENYEKWFKVIVNERVEAQVKCEEYAHSLNSIAKELEAEKNKSEKLASLVESFGQKKNDQNELTNRLKNQTDEIIALKNTITQLQTDIELTRSHVRQLEQQNEQLEKPDPQKIVQSNDVSSHNSTLKDLTQKVQKQVDLAALLDENMLQSLEFDSKTESFLEELTRLSPLTEELRQILVKILQYGFEALDMQERRVLKNTYDMFDDTYLNQIETLKNSVLNLSELVEQLQLTAETERKNNKELGDKNYKLQLEMNRLETVHRYFEERISFLITKLDEYRTKAVKTEIELTTEKTTRRQIEFSFDRYKKQAADKQLYEAKKLEEIVDQLNATSNENLKLKQESEILRNKVESLIAELNSVKAITQYHSDSETELSRSLNPLKERLNELEEKYAKLKHEYEKKKMELRNIKSNLNLERQSVKKLEEVLKEVSSEKRKLEKQLVDTKSSLDDLMWQKQKAEEKLEAAELAEQKRRKMQSVKDVAVKKEYECSKEFQRKLEQECEEFQRNVTKLADELVAFKNSCKQVTQEAQRIFLRMLRAESSQRSLVYQKNYLVVTLHQYEKKCNGIVRSITSGTKNFSNYLTAEKIPLRQKFRSYVFCIISMHRMQILISRRINNNFTKMKNYFITHIPEIATRPDDCFDFITVKKLCNGESKKTDTAEAEELLLQNICQQYARLRDIYVNEAATN